MYETKIRTRQNPHKIYILSIHVNIAYSILNAVDLSE